MTTITDAQASAAAWLAAQETPPHPLIPALKAGFGLTAKQACEAIAAARGTAARGASDA